MSTVTIKEETALFLLDLVRAWELHTARAAAAVKTNGETSVTHLQTVEDAIRDLNRGLYG